MHEALYAKIDALSAVLAKDGYDGCGRKVAALITECRLHLTELEKLGAWEIQSLERADDAARAGMLKLALIMVQRALDVSQLPAAEYRAGYNYTRKYGSDENRG